MVIKLWNFSTRQGSSGLCFCKCCGVDFFHPDFTSRMFFCFSYGFPIPAPDAATFPPTRRRPFPEGQARASIFIAARAQASAHDVAQSCGGARRLRALLPGPREMAEDDISTIGRAPAPAWGHFFLRLIFSGARRFSCPPRPDILHCIDRAT